MVACQHYFSHFSFPHRLCKMWRWLVPLLLYLIYCCKQYCYKQTPLCRPRFTANHSINSAPGLDPFAAVLSQHQPQGPPVVADRDHPFHHSEQERHVLLQKIGWMSLGIGQVQDEWWNKVPTQEWIQIERWDLYEGWDQFRKGKFDILDQLKQLIKLKDGFELHSSWFSLDDRLKLGHGY